MKTRALQVRIEKPCQEDWQRMNDHEQGKYCLSCQKNVVDFSHWTDAEIYQYLNQYGEKELCGRFFEQQLNRPIQEKFERKSPLTALKVAASLFVSLLASHSATSQDNDSSSTIAQQEAPQKPMRQIVLSGVLTEAETGKPLPFTKVSFSEKDSTLTDSTGMYRLEVFTSDTSIALKVAPEGYQSTWVHASVEHLLQEHSSILEKNHEVELQPEFTWELPKETEPLVKFIDLGRIEHAVYGCISIDGYPNSGKQYKFLPELTDALDSGSTQTTDNSAPSLSQETPSVPDNEKPVPENPEPESPGLEAEAVLPPEEENE